MLPASDRSLPCAHCKTSKCSVDCYVLSTARLSLHKVSAMARTAECGTITAQAILQLDQMEDPDQDWLVSALLRRLADDALNVVAAALSCKALMQVPAGGLFEAVSSTLSRVWEALQRKDQSVSSAKAQAVIKHVSLLCIL